MAGILRDRHLNIFLSRSVHVGGSILGSMREVHMLTGQSPRNVFDIRHLSEFKVNRKSVSVKDRSLHQQQ